MCVLISRMVQAQILGVMRSRLKQIVHIGPPFLVTETEHQYCFNLFSLIETVPIYVGLWVELNFSFTHLGYGECSLLCLLHSIPPPLMVRVCAHIFLDANQEFTATAPRPCRRQKCISGCRACSGIFCICIFKGSSTHKPLWKPSQHDNGTQALFTHPPLSSGWEERFFTL